MTFIHTHRRRRRTFSAPLRCAALIALLATGCSGSDGARPDDPVQASGAGPLTTTLRDGGNSVYPPKGAGAAWTASFGSLLICSPEQVTITDVVPHFKAGESQNEIFMVRTVPDAAERQGPPIRWAPLGTSTETLVNLGESGELRYESLNDAANAKVDQACDESPDASFTEILTSVSVGSDGAWIDRLNVEYDLDGDSYSLPVDWSYVACGDAIEDPDIC